MTSHGTSARILFLFYDEHVSSKSVNAVCLFCAAVKGHSGSSLVYSHFKVQVHSLNGGSEDTAFHPSCVSGVLVSSLFKQ